MAKDKRGSPGFMWMCLSLWVLQSQLGPVSSMVSWTAFVEITFKNPTTNNTQINACECGLYGSDSLVDQAAGFIALPVSDITACEPNATFSFRHEPWIALIKRGNCTDAVKILAAHQYGAAAVVIYNPEEDGNKTEKLSNSGIDDIVAILVRNVVGCEIRDLVEKGVDVFMRIDVGNPRGLWLDPFWVYIMSFIFFGITAVILGYFIYVLAKRLYRNRQLLIRQREMKKVAEKAIARLEVRTLRRNDPELESDDITCAICIDAFKRCDVVTTLPCSHIFHKTCVEPWLLEHHTCPMCKYDILKGEVWTRSESPSAAPPEDLSIYSVSESVGQTPDVFSFTQQHEETSINTDANTGASVIQLSDIVYEELSCEGKDQGFYANAAFEDDQQDGDLQTHQV